eukprot:symbB.v1.2.025709.t1/scaffold2513.1/size77311/2
MRPSADPDDMEDILRHVRRGVEARTQTQLDQDLDFWGGKSSLKPSTSSMARCQSEATVAQEEPSLAPRAAVRGRYVFSGQVLGPPGRLGAPESGEGLTMSPRPLDFARRPRRTEDGVAPPAGLASTRAAEAMAAECAEEVDI